MKHVFVVHSNITYLSALGVITAENLSLDDCLLVGDGSFVRPNPVPIISIPYLRGLRANKYNISHYLCPEKAVDKMIQELVGEHSYTLYFSVTIPLARVLLSNPLCCFFHIIEEGISAYAVWFDLSALTVYNSDQNMRAVSLSSRLRDLKRPLLRGYTSKIAALPIHYTSYQHPDRRFYGFSDLSYVQLTSGQRIKLAFEAIADRFSFPRKLDLDNRLVWLGDCVDATDTTLQTYLRAIERGFIDKVLVPGDIKHILLKFHYREPLASRTATLALFANRGIEVQVIANEVIMELEFLHTHTASLYGTYSSLLLYAALSGNKAYSVDRQYTPSILDRRMPIFWDFVTKL